EGVLALVVEANCQNSHSSPVDSFHRMICASVPAAACAPLGIGALTIPPLCTVASQVLQDHALNEPEIETVRSGVALSTLYTGKEYCVGSDPNEPVRPEM